VWRGTLHLFCEGSLFEKPKDWTACRTMLSGTVEQGEAIGWLQLFMKARLVIFSRGHQTAVESQRAVESQNVKLLHNEELQQEDYQTFSILLIMWVELCYQSVSNTCQI
jgi:hypothetical protein